MKIFVLRWLALASLAATAAAQTPQVVPATSDTSLERLDHLVHLNRLQRERAHQIFVERMERMDQLALGGWHTQKALKTQNEARDAIRAILEPQQLAVYDVTPAAWGGGVVDDPAKAARQLLLFAALRGCLSRDSGVVGTVGALKAVVPEGRWGYSGWPEGPAEGTDLDFPEYGYDTVRVIGTKGSQLYRVEWHMSFFGRMSLTRVLPWT